jgi:hypothetical protein
MGWSFSMKTANVVGWMTAPDHLRPPVENLDTNEIRMFLESLGWGRTEDSGFITDDPSWLEAIARDRKLIIDMNSSWGEERFLRDGLHLLLRHFASFDVFAIAVATESGHYERLKAFMHHAAYATGRSGLFMIPDHWALQHIELENPFPAVACLTDAVASWPGVVFWTHNGTIAFAELNEVEELYIELRNALMHTKMSRYDQPNLSRASAVDDVLERHENRRRHRPTLLHLSDLHFGTDEALRRQSYLALHINRLITENHVGRTVITGDLFNNPTEQDALHFLNFRQEIVRYSGKDPIIVPGNHDQKVFGNFHWSLRQLSELEWSSVVTDESLEAVFMCFDSSKDGVLAKGKITKDQLLAVGNAHDHLQVSHPALRGYMKIALLHHHPFSFDVPPKGLWQAFEMAGIKKEQFLRMEDGDKLVEWCAHRGVTLIMHGHKHVPIHHRDWIRTNSGQRKVDSVGCGSSTGYGDLPLSVNVVSWGRDRLAVKFLLDPGDGRGFANTLVQVNELEID